MEDKNWHSFKKPINNEIHCWPEFDLIVHNLIGEGCACRPEITRWPKGTLVTHRSLRALAQE
jgi:hypothetical protein